jgi:hypothetical protein
VRSATTATGPSAQGRYLAVYLNDHLAGSTAIVELVRRAAREHEGTELGGFLVRLGADIAQDRQALRQVMDAAGARPDVLKILAAWTAEKVGRLKLNGRLTGRSPLSPFVELEAIEVGVYGKLLLWQVLRDRRPPGAGAVDLDELIRRAQRQLDEVERHRRDAAEPLGA